MQRAVSITATSIKLTKYSKKNGFSSVV